MRGDLNEQFQRAQAVTSPNTMPKWVIAAIVVLILSLGIVIIAGTVFFVKLLDKVVASDPNDTSGSYTEDTTIDLYGSASLEDSLAGSLSGSSSNSSSGSSWGSSGNSSSGSLFGNSSSYKDVTANFKFGTVTGTSYYSEFSGISFKAPSDWNMTSYSNSGYVNLLSPKDISASSADLKTTVTISYKAMKSHLYTDLRDALATQIKVATNGANNSMVDENISEEFGGNKFTGIRYMKEMQNYSYYMQAMVAEVNGYILEIYIEADTVEQLETVLNMFN